MAARMASSSGLAKSDLQNALSFGSRQWLMEHAGAVAQHARFRLNILNPETDCREIGCALAGLPSQNFAVSDEIGDHDPVDTHILCRGMCQ